MQAYEVSGGKAVAARVRSIRINFMGKKTSYLFWKLISQPSIIRDDFIVTFGGGAVLTRAMLREQDISDDSFLTVAATADDLWYSKLMRLNNNEVIVVPELMNELNFIEHNDGLKNNNYPRVASFIHKVRLRAWDRPAGFFGFPVCGNDVAYAQIDQHFETVL